MHENLAVQFFRNYNINLCNLEPTKQQSIAIIHQKRILGRISGRILVACSTVQGFNVNYSLFMRQRVEAVWSLKVESHAEAWYCIRNSLCSNGFSNHRLETVPALPKATQKFCKKFLTQNQRFTIVIILEWFRTTYKRGRQKILSL